MKGYEVDTQGRDLMVLDVLELLKAQDPSLAYRRSCREGVCGSDGININGKNGLACIMPLSEAAPKGKLVLRPLPGLPVIRDLVVDMRQFYTQYEKVEPYLQSDIPAEGIERVQTPEQREKLDGLYECILCACCSTSCPSFWWNPDKFIGPAGPAAVLPFPGGQPRYRHSPASGEPQRPIQCVSLPHHPELCCCLPQGVEPHQGNRAYSPYAAVRQGLMG